MKAKLIGENIDLLRAKSREDIDQEKLKRLKQLYHYAYGIGEVPGAGTHNYEDENFDPIEDEEAQQAIDIIMFFYNIPGPELEELGLQEIHTILATWDGSDGRIDTNERILNDIQEVLENAYESNKHLMEAGGAGGAGYATWGGGWGRSFGNPSMGGRFTGRGFGFGQSNTTGGPNLMYTYSVKPLNQTLEPLPSEEIDEPYIHVGSVIKGRILGKKGEDSHIISQVLRVEEDDDGNIKYYLTLDENGVKQKIDPTSAFIFEPEEELSDFSIINAADVQNHQNESWFGRKKEKPTTDFQHLWLKAQRFLGRIDPEDFRKRFFYNNGDLWETLGEFIDSEFQTYLNSIKHNEEGPEFFKVLQKAARKKFNIEQ